MKTKILNEEQPHPSGQTFVSGLYGFQGTIFKQLK